MSGLSYQRLSFLAFILLSAFSCAFCAALAVALACSFADDANNFLLADWDQNLRNLVSVAATFFCGILSIFFFRELLRGVKHWPKRPVGRAEPPPSMPAASPEGPRFFPPPQGSGVPALLGPNGPLPLVAHADHPQKLAG